jgi:hypothetical protein
MSLNIRDKVDAFILLLSNPNPDDGYSDATAMYSKEDKSEYMITAYKIYRGLMK